VYILNILGLSGVSTDLGQQKVNTEWCLLVDQETLEFRNLLPQHVWGISDTTDNTETAGIRDGCGKLRTSCDVHASKKNWVVDLQEIRKGRPELFYS
jgi:hypothetical protein